MSHGVWRIVQSAKFNAPFFYNSSTNTGQFDIPDDLRGIHDSNSHSAIMSTNPTQYCSPTQRDLKQSDDDAENSGELQDNSDIIFATYQSLNNFEEDIKRESNHCEDETISNLLGDIDKSDYEYQCTLVDGESQMVHSPVVENKPHGVVHDDDCLMGDFQDSSPNSVLDLAHNNIGVPSCDLQRCEEGNKDRNECPFCTFINPPLALVCEICLGEITQPNVSGY